MKFSSYYKKMFAMGIISITIPFGAFFGNSTGGSIPATQVVQVTQPQVTQPLAPNSPVGVNTSENWSGYVASGNNTYTSVTGTWIVPAVTAAANENTSADATWVGIGGTTSQTLIQAGTQAVVNGSGNITYQAWYEMLPQATQPTSLTVSPGNSITATVTQTSPGEWAISLVDNTTGQSFNTSLQYSASLSSAEWIEEMPSNENTLIPLDNFGTISFTGGSAVQNGTSVTIAQSGAVPLTMVNQAGQVLSSPSALSSDGESFIVTRGSATPSTASGGGRYVIIPQGRSWRRTGVGLQGYATGTPRTYVRVRTQTPSQSFNQQQWFKMFQQLQTQMQGSFSFMRVR
jgi:Peptidase A4 family